MVTGLNECKILFHGKICGFIWSSHHPWSALVCTTGCYDKYMMFFNCTYYGLSMFISAFYFSITLFSV